MSLGDFIKRFADEFEDMEDGAIGADTVFTELEDWNSLSTLGVIAMVKMELLSIFFHLNPPDAGTLLNSYPVQSWKNLHIDRSNLDPFCLEFTLPMIL